LKQSGETRVGHSQSTPNRVGLKRLPLVRKFQFRDSGVRSEPRKNTHTTGGILLLGVIKNREVLKGKKESPRHLRNVWGIGSEEKETKNKNQRVEIRTTITTE